MEEIIFNFLENLSTFSLFLFIGLSLYVLGKGADLFVDQAVKISINWGIPKLIVGATIVSLGTTIPEASVSVISALKGNPDLALGNAIGSIIANTALILGVASLVGEVPVDRRSIDRQGKLLITASLILSIISLPVFSSGGDGLISQKTGILFLLMLVYYIYSTIKWGMSEDIEDDDLDKNQQSIVKQLFILFFGIFIVVVSSNVLIPSVEIIAIRMGIPQSIIASTLVAFGTSLPELVTAITSVKKGHGELAVGNIVGANILNILLVIGLSAAVTKEGLFVPFDFYKLQIPTMLVSLGLFFYYAKNDDGKISKLEGSILILIYGVYLFMNYFTV